MGVASWTVFVGSFVLYLIFLLARPPGLPVVLIRFRVFLDGYLDAVWQNCVIQPVLEVSATCQALEATWKSHVAHALVEIPTKCQTLKAARKSHDIQALIAT